MRLAFLLLFPSALTSFTAKWCNKYFCLDADLPDQPHAEITYALAARTDDMGWLAVGTGYEMKGSKMWIMWPDQAGGCVLSERDGVGYKPPTITQQPLARLLEHPTNETHFTCHFSLPATALPFFNDQSPTNITAPMGMLWAYSTTPPTSSSTEKASDAPIKRHDVFGIFDLAFKRGDDPAAETPAMDRRKRIIHAHAAFMTIAWAVTAPIAVLFARFGRGTFSKWVAAHQSIQIGLTASCTFLGFVLVVVAIRMRDGRHFAGPHEILGLLLVLLLLFQIASGLWIHRMYNATRTHRPPRNFIHMAVGCCLLVGGLANVKLGIGKWGDEKWMVVTFWVWTGLLVATFTVGFSLLPRQLRTESNALNRKNPDVRLSRIQASFPAHRFSHPKDKTSPSLSAGSPSPSSAEQGAAQVQIKYPWHKGTHTLPTITSASDDINSFSIPPPNAGYRDRPSPLGTSPTRDLTGARRNEGGTVAKDDLAGAQRELLRSRKM